MTALSRLRAHAGQWTLVGLLGAAMVFTTAAAGPVTIRIEDRGLAAGIEQAPYRLGT